MISQNLGRVNPGFNEYDPIQLRYEMGWTLEELAYQLDYSVSAVTKWSANVSKPARRARRCAYKVWKAHQKGS